MLEINHAGEFVSNKQFQEQEVTFQNIFNFYLIRQNETLLQQYAILGSLLGRRNRNAKETYCAQFFKKTDIVKEGYLLKEGSWRK